MLGSMNEFPARQRNGVAVFNWRYYLLRVGVRAVSVGSIYVACVPVSFSVFVFLVFVRWRWADGLLVCALILVQYILMTLISVNKKVFVVVHTQLDGLLSFKTQRALSSAAGGVRIGSSDTSPSRVTRATHTSPAPSSGHAAAARTAAGKTRRALPKQVGGSLGAAAVTHKHKGTVSSHNIDALRDYIRSAAVSAGFSVPFLAAAAGAAGLAGALPLPAAGGGVTGRMECVSHSDTSTPSTVHTQ